MTPALGVAGLTHRYDRVVLDDVADFASCRADRQSGGQQQRVAIVRALAQRSKAILADEPVASLGPASSATVRSVLRPVAAGDGAAVVCSLHQAGLVGTLADRVIGLRKGRVLIDAPVAHFDERAQDLVHARHAETAPSWHPGQR